MCIYIYIYICTYIVYSYTYCKHPWMIALLPLPLPLLLLVPPQLAATVTTPNPPTNIVDFRELDLSIRMPSPPIKSFPIKSPWVKLSRRLPIKFNGHEKFPPLKIKSLLESNPLKSELLVGGLESMIDTSGYETIYRRRFLQFNCFS